MKVTMSLTQETIDKLDTIQAKLGASSRSDTVRLLAEQATDNSIANKLDVILDAVNTWARPSESLTTKLDTLIEGMTRLLENPAVDIKRLYSVSAPAINTVETTKQAVKPLGKHKTYFKADKQ